MSKEISRFRRNMLSFSAMVGFFLLWEIICRALDVSDLVLPVPSQIAAVLIDKMPILWPHTQQTLMTTLVGFFLGVFIGLIIGVVIGSSRIAYDIAYPLLVAFSSTRTCVCSSARKESAVWAKLVE